MLQVLSMRRQLLAMLHMNEFSKEAAWRDPCRAIELQDVMCSSCGAVVDLDVCREAASVASGMWHCGNCSEPFECDRIEQRLLARVSQTVSGYQLQDLVCIRCGAVSAGGMRMQCEQCGEGLRLTITKESVWTELSVFRSIAQFHGMLLLAEAATTAAAVT
jgi:DNA polymerase epsilon subunit 1